MKLRKIVTLAAAVAAVALVMPAVEAGCSSGIGFSNWNASAGRYYYVNFGDTSGNVGNLVGRYYQTDNPTTDNDADDGSGSYEPAEWMKEYYAGTDGWYINGTMGRPNTDCVSGSMTVELTNTATANWVIATQAEGSGFPQFDFSSQSMNFVAASMTPGVTGSSRNAAGDVTLDLNVPDPAAGVYGGTAIDGVDIVSTTTTGGAPDPNIAAGGWSVIGSVGPNGGPASGVVVPGCTGSTGWIASAVVSNGSAAQEVSGGVRQVECDPNLADPPANIDLIERPGKPGRGDKKPGRK